MVSKLLLSVQETCLKSINNTTDEVLIGNLLDHYYEINEGIGVNKSPLLYGAFPTDPYSHTPGGKGAQQPGMTGQVKEDILCRFGELGVFVTNGSLSFNPRLLRREEFLKKTATFKYTELNKAAKEIQLEVGTLAFTYCQVPIIYKLSYKSGIKAEFSNQEILESSSLILDINTSNKLFKRTGEINLITVYIKK